MVGKYCQNKIISRESIFITISSVKIVLLCQSVMSMFVLAIRIRIGIAYWWHINWHTFTRVNEWEDYSLDLINDENLEMQSSTFSRGYSRCRECILISNSFRKETMPISSSPSIWDLKWFWMMVSSMSKRGF